MQAVCSSAQISGRVSFREQSSDSPAVDLQLAWQQLTWPLDAKENYLIASDSGKARVTGELDAYRATVRAQLAVPAYPSGEIDITGAGSRHGFTLEQMALPTLGGDVLGRAAVDWNKGIKATFELSGENIDRQGWMQNGRVD
ncbi:MAG: translocation and assembly module TamB [Candidatus Azotimanducaceae bacterium]|jgi:translocation and assembly module TamB